MAKIVLTLAILLVVLNMVTSCPAQENVSAKINKNSEPITKVGDEKPEPKDKQSDNKEEQKEQQDAAAAKPKQPETTPAKAKTEQAEPAETKPVKSEKPEEKPASAKQKKNKPKWTVPFYEKYAKLLEQAVNDEGMVNYKELRRHRQDLRTLLAELAELDRDKYKTWPKEDKIALWANTYNIQMLKIITDNYPIKASRIHLLWWPPTSIRHIKGIWSDYKFIVMDEEFTLSEIDKRFFRKGFNEPRVFFAI
ncbi:MAG: DUF547 domain-containing protein, partial [Planctomycetota bacterium]